MDLIVNAAPVAVSLLVCAIAWVSVRQAYRQGTDLPSEPRAEDSSAAE